MSVRARLAWAGFLVGLALLLVAVVIGSVWSSRWGMILAAIAVVCLATRLLLVRDALPMPGEPEPWREVECLIPDSWGIVMLDLPPDGPSRVIPMDRDGITDEEIDRVNAAMLAQFRALYLRDHTWSPGWCPASGPTSSDRWRATR